MRHVRSQSMQKECFSIREHGFSLIEVVLSSAVFALLVTALLGAYLYGEESTMTAGSRARAVFLAEEGLEATRSIRDNSYSSLAAGTYGLAINSGVWEFSGSSDINGIFTRNIVVSSVDADRQLVTSNISWQQNQARSGNVSLATRLTNWKDTAGASVCSDQADYLAIDTSSASIGAGNRELQDVFIENTNGTCDIVIDKITITWTNAARTLTRVRIDNSSVWTGSASTGDVLDIDDTTIANTDGQLENTYRFNQNMKNNTFNITFEMDDGTTKTESSIAP